MKAERIRLPRFILHPSSFILLLFLTFLGGILRFAFLTRPTIWGDEAATYMRVCGSFADLRHQLAIWGFAPLHYMLYWEIRQHTPLTPWMLRMPVALAGTLMVPAMYFLAIQLVPRKTAMLAAALTAFSAYMLNYSRDAKMYSELWLLVALHFGSLFWWLRTRQAVAWWAWVAGGVIMLGIHSIALALLPIELLILLTSRNLYWKSFGVLLLSIIWLPFIPIVMVLRWVKLPRLSERIAVGRWLQRQFSDFHWPPLFFWIVGCAIMLIGPYLYYTQFNVYLQFLERQQSNPIRWSRSGLGWVEYYNYGRDGVDLLKYTGSAFLDNWEWPRAGDEASIPPLALKLLKAGTLSLFALLLIGILPWRLIGRDDDLSQTIGPHFRGILWLLLWTILPSYGFYCASSKQAAWPIDWIGDLLLKHPPTINWTPPTHSWSEFFRGWSDGLVKFAHAFTNDNVQWWLIVLILAAIGAWLALCPYDWRNRLRRVAIVVQMIVLLFVLCMLVRIAIAQPMPGSVWMPRYLGMLWPAMAIVMAVLFMRLPTKPLRITAVALFIMVNVAQHGARIFATSEPPSDLMAHDVVISQPPSSTSRLYYRVGRHGLGDPGTGTLQSSAAAYFLALYSGRPVVPDDIDYDYIDRFEIWSGLSLLPFEPYIAHTLEGAPTLKQIIVWDEPGKTEFDNLPKLLPPTWKQQSYQVFQVRDHWIWANMYRVRRRVYVRDDSPPTSNPG